MANINRRLQTLAARRKGVTRSSTFDSVNAASFAEQLTKGLLLEEYEKRASNQPNTRYTLGAMQEVDAKGTKISLDTAERVGKQLKAGIEAKGGAVDFRLQGSVPLNVHIKGHSDVDLLCLEGTFLTYHPAGVRALRGAYRSTPRTSLGSLWLLREDCEEILQKAYPGATVDTKGGKAIKLFGGSLARPVDVVPSHWNDNLPFQVSGNEIERGVTILDKGVPATVENLPFLHIDRISQRCGTTYGGLRKSIRLCKNIKADAEEDEGKKIALPSFDIAALMYHADTTKLMVGLVRELYILAETQRHLDFLYHNVEHAKALVVPDGSRLVLNTPDKIEGMKALSVELDNLLLEVTREHAPHLFTSGTPTFEACRNAISYIALPNAAATA